MTADDDLGYGEVLPGQDRPPVRRSAKIAVVVIAGAVAGAVVVALVVTGGSGRDNAAARRPPTSAVPTGTVASNGAVVIDPGQGRAGNVSPCDQISGDGLNCRTAIGVPHPVTVAVRALFPQALIDASFTVLERNNTIYTRRLSVQAGPRVITVEISPTTGKNGSRKLSGPGRTIARFDEDVRDHHVLIEVVDPAHDPTTPAELGRLARDPRLLAAD